MNHTGIIILAAGNSSRMGTPKQVLDFEGKSLLRHVIDEASLHPDHRIVVVLGASHEMTGKELTGTRAKAVVNRDWQEGMSSSIKKGLQTILQAYPDIERCIIAVCDQPYVNANVFHELKIQALETGNGIIATGFAGTWGVPVLFSKRYFEELLSLEGPEGAKKIVKRHLDDMAVFPFGPAMFDIDTKEDYSRLKKQMISVQEAKEIIEQYSPEPAVSRDVAIEQASGYTVASDVIAPFSIPNFAQSSMDGYAIRYADKDRELEVTGTIPAGDTVEKEITSGQAMRIFTGAPLPKGADTVVMQEKVERGEGGTITVKDGELGPGSNVRPKGSEVGKGEIAMKSGTHLSPAAIGYLAGIGCTHVDIYAPPRVTLMLTGDELKPLGSELRFGEVYESNSLQLTAALKQVGIRKVESTHVRDDMAQLKSAMEQSLENSDILLLVGGVSVGDYDFVTQVATECGVEQRFHRIRQKPGKPLFFGTYGKKLVFGLPGNPSSALTCFYLYVAPALEKMMNLPNRIKKTKATVTHDYRKKAGLTHFLKGSYDAGSATPLHAQESYRLQSYAQANCLIVVPEDTELLAKGSEVEIYLI